MVDAARKGAARGPINGVVTRVRTEAPRIIAFALSGVVQAITPDPANAPRRPRPMHPYRPSFYFHVGAGAEPESEQEHVVEFGQMQDGVYQSGVSPPLLRMRGLTRDAEQQDSRCASPRTLGLRNCTRFCRLSSAA
jgi:hypothetical protein